MLLAGISKLFIKQESACEKLCLLLMFEDPLNYSQQIVVDIMSKVTFVRLGTLIKFLGVEYSMSLNSQIFYILFVILVSHFVLGLL